MRLYDDLASWWPLLSPPESMLEEAAQVERWLGASRILELGSGAGMLASCFTGPVELVDRAPAMLAVSETLNPRTPHHEADLRTVRLGQRFDGVLLHDAVMYLLTEDDLRAAFQTAWEHLLPGGRFVILPDFCAEDFEEHVVGGGGSEEGRSIQLMEWHWNPGDGAVRVEFSALLREHGQVQAVHETHRMGLHSRQTWWTLLREVGFEPVELPWDDLRGEGEALLVERPS